MPNQNESKLKTQHRFTPHHIVLYLTISIALLTAWAFQKCSRPQQLMLCRSLHNKALQAIASEGLAQGPYMAARAWFEPTIHRSKGIASTNVPPCKWYTSLHYMPIWSTKLKNISGTVLTVTLWLHNDFASWA